MVSPGPPSAGGKGYQVRLYHQILGLAERHRIDLVSFSPDGRVDSDVQAACEFTSCVRWTAAMAARSALANGVRLPFSVALFRSRAMSGALAGALERGPDLVQLQLVRMAPYLEELAGTPSVIDLLDASALGMRERARASRTPARQLFDVEADRLSRYEKGVIAGAGRALLISRRDFEYAGSPPNARILSNGIDPVEPSPASAQREPKKVIFSGTMSFFPNADAAIWFGREIMPLVREATPDASFKVVGREPTRDVQALGSLPGVTVTGPVERIADELTSAAVSVCPMRYGSGMQTKILEAMAAGTPVVATGKGMEGIPEDLHRFLHRADSTKAFAAETARILEDPRPALQLATQAVEVIRREHTWARHVLELETIYDEAIAAASDRRTR
jgi:glycosyltransferase involved in cell wall biosynthesis